MKEPTTVCPSNCCRCVALLGTQVCPSRSLPFSLFSIWEPRLGWQKGGPFDFAVACGRGSVRFSRFRKLDPSSRSRLAHHAHRSFRRGAVFILSFFYASNVSGFASFGFGVGAARLSCLSSLRPFSRGLGFFPSVRTFRAGHSANKALGPKR